MMEAGASSFSAMSRQVRLLDRKEGLETLAVRFPLDLLLAFLKGGLPYTPAPLREKGP